MPVSLATVGSILKIAAPIALIAVVYSCGVGDGKSVVQDKWNEQIEANKKEIALQKELIAIGEQKNRDESRRIADELVKIKEASVGAINAIQSDTAERMRDISRRELVYRSQAEAGATERANLASHAAQLDRSLTEGIGLVGELQATLELRDGQIRQLASQINSDRQLISGSGNTNGNDAAHPE